MADRRSRLLAGAALVLLFVTAGCQEQLGVIDRTQAGLLHKSLFEGEWFMRRTVIDVPYDVGYTFVGEQEDTVRIRWDIQREHLVAYRVLPLVDGTPDSAPVAVFRIEDHADIYREYNEATGEESNVVSENDEDRMWYERAYVRVDWSKNLITNFSFYVDQLDMEGVAFHVSDQADDERLLVGVKQEDGSWLDVQDERALQGLRDAQYLDVVTRVLVKPETFDVEDWDGSIIQEPACWYYLNYDCAPGVVSIRNAFLRVDAALSDYEPLEYPDNYIVRGEDQHPINVRWTADGDRERVVDGATDSPAAGDGETPAEPVGTNPADPYATTESGLVRIPMFDKFGYFRVERFGYDPLFGEVEAARTFLANRWNLWQKSFDGEGRPLPYAERGYRPIVYYLSPDFPAELRAAAEKAIDRWNEAFRETVGTLAADTAPPRMYELRDNTRVVDAATGAVVRRGELIGDLRYSHLYLITAPTRAGLLGYGPSATDPLTGEIFAADAFIYGASAKELAAKGRQIVQLLNGDLTPEDLAEGRDVQAYLATLATGGRKVEAPLRAEVEAFADAHPGPARAPGAAADKKPTNPATPSSARRPELDRLRRPAGWADARLSILRGTAFEDLMMGIPEVLGMKGAGVLGPDAKVAGLSAAMRERLSPARWAAPAHRRASQDRIRSYASHNILMASFYDDAVAGLAIDLKDRDPDEVLHIIEEAIFRSTSEHELGHTLGLRHNFEGSSDALNYHSEYWALRGNDPQPMAELSRTEREGRLREFQYSSIMDYAGRFNADIAGLGPYDRAAIRFGYGQLVDVFETAPDEPLVDVVELSDGTYTRAFTLDTVLRKFRHYTNIPRIFGGTENLAKRRAVPYTPDVARLMGVDESVAYTHQLTGDGPWQYWEVPYRFCSDEYEYGTATCLMFDMGADRYEVVADTVERYWNYYWFNNFKRDRVFFDEWDYYDTMWGRYFAFILNAYQNWVFDQWFVADTWNRLRDDAARWGIEDVPWTKAEDAGLTSTAAAREGLRFLQQVIAMPEPGGYMYDPYEGYYWSLSADPLPVCEGEPSYTNAEWCADANVGLGDGRWFYSLYDWDSGYYFYERLKWVGTFWDKILALDCLTNPDTYFLGVSEFQSVDAWAISMNLYFPNEIETLFSAIAADRFDLFAGTFDEEGRYRAPDPFTPRPATIELATAPVDPYTSFTIQLYTLWYGMAWLNANYDNSFNDAAKIWLKGSGEAIEPATTDPNQIVEFESPTNGRVYVALRPTKVGRAGLGVLMLEQAEKYRLAWAEAAANPATDPGTLDYLFWRVENIVENIEVARGLFSLYGTMVF